MNAKRDAEPADVPARGRPDGKASTVGQFEQQRVGTRNLDRAYGRARAQEPPVAGRNRPQRHQQPGDDAAGHAGGDHPNRDCGEHMHTQYCCRENARRRKNEPERAGERQTRVNTSVPFVPPKPKEFDIAVLIVIWRAWFGT